VGLLSTSDQAGSMIRNSFTGGDARISDQLTGGFNIKGISTSNAIDITAVGTNLYAAGRGGINLIQSWRAGRVGAASADEIAIIPTIAGRKPINSKYAGQVHPSGVQFTAQGFPDFKPYAKAEVKIENLTGIYHTDAALANAAVGLRKTPKNFLWHHKEDALTMQLIPKSIHNQVRHTGGSAVIRNGGFDR
jgi:A nuclease of the HNH/ENDO VII superfamily with conserved WHH